MHTTKGFEVICPDCKQNIKHDCASELIEAIVQLLTWVPETKFASKGLEREFFKAGKANGWDPKKSDLEEPFFGSQAWSYPLFGVKDTARSFHGLINQVARAAGLNPNEIMTRYYQERETRETEENKRKALVAKKKAKRKVAIRYMQGLAPLPKRIARLEAVLRHWMRRMKFKTLEELDEYYTHLETNYIHNFYAGGISPEVNKQVVEKLRAEAHQKFPEPLGGTPKETK